MRETVNDVAKSLASAKIASRSLARACRTLMEGCKGFSIRLMPQHFARPYLTKASWVLKNSFNNLLVQPWKCTVPLNLRLQPQGEG